MSNEISDTHQRIIEAKKRIEYRYAKPYLEPPEKKPGESEADFRERVASVITDLPREERKQLKKDKRHEYKQIKGITDDFNYRDYEAQD